MPAANVPWSLGAEVLEGTDMVAREGGWGRSLGSGHVPSGVTNGQNGPIRPWFSLRFVQAQRTVLYSWLTTLPDETKTQGRCPRMATGGKDHHQ